MSADTAYLALLLDAPLQSWGFESRFQRRTTGLYPTKSAIIGLICAAMGLAKGTDAERETLLRLTTLKMTSIAIARDYLRLEDFHTVGAAYDENDTWERQMMIHNADPRKRKLRKIEGRYNPDITRRQYLADARFGIILAGNHELIDRVASALEDPVWGVWFGRKSCIPAEPIYRGLFASPAEAEKALIGDVPLESFTTMTEVESFAEGTDSLNDQPVSFGDGTSSGPEKRQFAIRRIKVQPGVGLPEKG